MTKKDPEGSVHEEQFNADKKAVESTEETLNEMAASELPATEAVTDQEDAIPDDGLKAESTALAEEEPLIENTAGEAAGEDDTPADEPARK